MKNKYKLFVPTILSFLIILFIYIYYGFAPFGNKTLAINDANIQYLDLYMYYKNVFVSKDSFIYSFSNGLGGNMMAVFSYYLASPFMLLSLLFKNEDLYSYFNICVLLKLTTAAFTSSYYLKNRFNLDLDNTKDFTILLGLSLGYSLSQYSIVQSSNIMWLDGVYMLPVMLLNIYNLINNKKNSFLYLSISTGLTIIFNWYIGLINCVFTVFYFVIEILLKKCEDKSFKANKPEYRYLLSMALGGLLGSIILLPTIYALSLSSRGSINIGSSFNYFGDIKSYITSYVYGGQSDKYCVCIYSGLYTLIGFISCLYCKDINNKKRLIYIGITLFIGLMFYWTPLLNLFSLFKDISSYYYRYSYLASFLLVFVSANFYKDSNDSNLPVISSLIYVFLLVILLIINKTQIDRNILFTIFTILLISIVLAIQKKNKLFNYLLILLILFDKFYSTKTLMNLNEVDDYKDYKEYIFNEETLINSIKENDDSLYRINSTNYRNQISDDDLASNYNEALAYNYYSIASYTSSPNDDVRNLLNNLGYRKSGENISVTSSNILAIDSLLGVKYILSLNDVNGLKKISDKTMNNKYLYENVYSLGIAFTYVNNEMDINHNNPFEYTNSLYSKLLGKNAEIYKRLEYEIYSEPDIYAGTPKIYKIDTSSYKNYAIYGYIPNNGNISGYLNIDNKYTIKYGEWLSPSLFYIDCDSKETFIELYLDGSYSNISEAQFYGLDLEVLKEVTDILKDRSVDINISLNKVNINVNSDESNENLFLSIPYDKGWSIIVNGKEAKYELIENCLYSIKLDKGNNEIVMAYYPPYLNLGIVISIFSLIISIYINKRMYKV